MKFVGTLLTLVLLMIYGVNLTKNNFMILPTLGDFTKFAESLFTDKKEGDTEQKDELYGEKLNKKLYYDGFNLVPLEEKKVEDDDLTIKNLMKVVITPDNEIDALYSENKATENKKGNLRKHSFPNSDYNILMTNVNNLIGSNNPIALNSEENGKVDEIKEIFESLKKKNNVKLPEQDSPIGKSAFLNKTSKENSISVAVNSPIIEKHIAKIPLSSTKINKKIPSRIPPLASTSIPQIPVKTETPVFTPTLNVNTSKALPLLTNSHVDSQKQTQKHFLGLKSNNPSKLNKELESTNKNILNRNIEQTIKQYKSSSEPESNLNKEELLTDIIDDMMM